MSSVYISISEFCIESGNSLMWIEKNNGPKINPPSTRESDIDVFPDRTHISGKDRSNKI